MPNAATATSALIVRILIASPFPRRGLLESRKINTNSHSRLRYGKPSTPGYAWKQSTYAGRAKSDLDSSTLCWTTSCATCAQWEGRDEANGDDRDLGPGALDEALCQSVADRPSSRQRDQLRIPGGAVPTHHTEALDGANRTAVVGPA